MSQNALINQIHERIRDMDVTLSDEAARAWVGQRLNLLKPLTWDEAQVLVHRFTLRGVPPVVFEAVATKIQCTDEERLDLYKKWFEVYARKWNLEYNRNLSSLLDGMPLLDHALRIVGAIPNMDQKTTSYTRDVLSEIMHAVINQFSDHRMFDTARTVAHSLNEALPSFWRQKIIATSNGIKNYSGVYLNKEVEHYARTILWCAPFIGPSLLGSLAQSLTQIRVRLQSKSDVLDEKIWAQLDALGTKSLLEKEVASAPSTNETTRRKM